MLIKFGWRYSLVSPSLFVLFLALRYGLKKIINLFEGKQYPSFNLLLIYVVQICMSSIFIWNQNRKNKTTIKPQFLGIALYDKTNVLKRPDSNCKIIVLLNFALSFEIIGALARQLATNSVVNYDDLYAKYRSSEIILASLLCFLTLNTKIFRHHIFILIIMAIYLIVSLILEFLLGEPGPEILFTILSCVLRVFLDITEKYLFNTDFIDLHKMQVFEGIINTIICGGLFLLKRPQSEFSKMSELYNGSKFDFSWWLSLSIIYCILTGFKNIYRRETIKEFTPMTRILAQSILDPIFIIFGDVDYNDTYFTIILVFSFVTIFCSCIYNEIFVLYCCGLEKDTHLNVMNSQDHYELAYTSTTSEENKENSML